MTEDEIEARAKMACEASNLETRHWPVAMLAVRVALRDLDKPLPPDPDIAASEEHIPSLLFWKSAEAVQKQAREIALAAYKAGKAAR